MVRHIVAWNFADGFTPEGNMKNAQAIKMELENLIHLIDGIVSINVYTDHLETSDADIILDSVFKDEEALEIYRTHPEHVRVGKEFVRPTVKNRKCIDFQL